MLFARFKSVCITELLTILEFFVNFCIAMVFINLVSKVLLVIFDLCLQINVSLICEENERLHCFIILFAFTDFVFRWIIVRLNVISLLFEVFKDLLFLKILDFFFGRLLIFLRADCKLNRLARDWQFDLILSISFSLSMLIELCFTIFFRNSTSHS